MFDVPAARGRDVDRRRVPDVVHGAEARGDVIRGARLVHIAGVFDLQPGIFDGCQRGEISPLRGHRRLVAGDGRAVHRQRAAVLRVAAIDADDGRRAARQDQLAAGERGNVQVGAGDTHRSGGHVQFVRRQITAKTVRAALGDDHSGFVGIVDRRAVERRFPAAQGNDAVGEERFAKRVLTAGHGHLAGRKRRVELRRAAVEADDAGHSDARSVPGARERVCAAGHLHRRGGDNDSFHLAGVFIIEHHRIAVVKLFVRLAVKAPFGKTVVADRPARGAAVVPKAAVGAAPEQAGVAAVYDRVERAAGLLARNEDVLCRAVFDTDVLPERGVLNKPLGDVVTHAITRQIVSRETSEAHN